MDREPYLRYFTANSVPAWKCPVCLNGLLKLSKENFLHRQTAASAEEQKLDHSEFDWIKTKAAAIFICSSCDEPVACAAHGDVDQVYGEDEHGEIQQDWEDQFTPRYFEPPLVLMDIPERCPDEVRAHLQTSFSMYFCNPSAAANSARIALEALLDHWGISRKQVNGDYLSLHSRLNQLPSPHNKHRDLLVAAKWLGNDGSHGGDLKKQNVNELYDILEQALHDAFDDRRNVILAKARAINASRKKP